MPLPVPVLCRGRRLSCQLYTALGDIFLGVPFNIASYALLTLMWRAGDGLEPGEFIHTFGDAHLYANHFDQAKLQLSRTPKALPVMKLNPTSGISSPSPMTISPCRL